jgi:hypothetical protein
MTLRIVTPSTPGATGVSFAWDCGTVWQPAGAVLDVPAGGALETAIGAGNLTAASAGALAEMTSGSGPNSASNG